MASGGQLQKCWGCQPLWPLPLTHCADPTPALCPSVALWLWEDHTPRVSFVQGIRAAWWLEQRAEEEGLCLLLARLLRDARLLLSASCLSDLVTASGGGAASEQGPSRLFLLPPRLVDSPYPVYSAALPGAPAPTAFSLGLGLKGAGLFCDGCALAWAALLCVGFGL